MDILKFADAALGIATGRVLSVECGRCTREAHFVGTRRSEVLVKAREAGWRYVEGREICPQCLREGTYTNDFIHNLANGVIDAANRPIRLCCSDLNLFACSVRLNRA